MITTQERINIIETLLSLLKADGGLTLSQAEKKTIKEVMLEHVTFLQAGIVDNSNNPTEK